MLRYKLGFSIVNMNIQNIIITQRNGFEEMRRMPSVYKIRITLSIRNVFCVYGCNCADWFFFILSRFAESNKLHTLDRLLIDSLIDNSQLILNVHGGPSIYRSVFVNTVINWVRFHVEQTKSGEFVILGFLIITLSHFFTYCTLIVTRISFSIYWQDFDVKFQVSSAEKLRFLWRRINYCSSFVFSKILFFNLK